MNTANPVQFILASSSPRRKALLEQAGYVIDSIISPDINEDPLKKELPKDLSLRLAEEKNHAVRSSIDDDNVIIFSADTVVACGRTMLPKPENLDQARMCLEMLSGRSNQVYTSLCVSGKSPEHGTSSKPDLKYISKTVKTVVKFKVLSSSDISAYLASGEWQGKAGGYSVQGYADCFIRMISGSYSNVVGLPLYTTNNILQSFGMKPRFCCYFLFHPLDSR
ncbi:MAG: Maf family protein, partial [Rickettsiales bacterium]|nr:Maf family protein [Rickettsiales bacterium]